MSKITIKILQDSAGTQKSLAELIIPDGSKNVPLDKAISRQPIEIFTNVSGFTLEGSFQQSVKILCSCF